MWYEIQKKKKNNPLKKFIRWKCIIIKEDKCVIDNKQIQQPIQNMDMSVKNDEQYDYEYHIKFNPKVLI